MGSSLLCGPRTSSSELTPEIQIQRTSPPSRDRVSRGPFSNIWWRVPDLALARAEGVAQQVGGGAKRCRANERFPVRRSARWPPRRGGPDCTNSWLLTPSRIQRSLPLHGCGFQRIDGRGRVEGIRPFPAPLRSLRSGPSMYASELGIGMHTQGVRGALDHFVTRPCRRKDRAGTSCSRRARREGPWLHE